ncbi:MAG: mechanosensitive ion channel family protein [Flavobacteriales bacterium]|jgi:small conductance mechanosensitive channel|nr:mechanosensitive ion channel family protein [Flavobacteriales bacterium]
MKDEPGKFESLMQGFGMDLLLLLKVIAILFAAWFVERLIYFALRRGYAKAKAQGREEMTRYRFFRNGVRTMMVILALIAIIYTIPSLRAFALTLFAGAGIIAVIIGLAAQKAFSDIISGAFIVAFKPFRVGDFIQAGETGPFGTVEDINLRHTTILTFENRRLLIPNSILSEDRIVNSSIKDESTCEFIEFTIGLESDVDLAIELLQKQAILHPDRIDGPVVNNMENPDHAITVRVVKVQDGSFTLRAYVWARDPVTARRLHYDMNHVMLKVFPDNGIHFGLPVRQIISDKPALAN